MTDEANPQGKKSASSGGGGGGSGNRKKSTSGPKPPVANNNQGATPRPSSTGSNRKPSGNTSEDGKKAEQKGSSAKGGQGGRGGHRKGQTSQSQTANRQGASSQSNNPQQPTAPVPVPVSEGTSDAMTSLQRMITDLKTISPPNQAVPIGQMHSSLPPTAPVFQPGAQSFPAGGDPNKHRKAASLGPQGSFPSQQFAPQLGSMTELSEEGRTPNMQQQFSEQQAFPAEQIQQAGPTGRPQLAPTFQFGGRRRTASNVPVGPPISEDDGFQFPQSQASPYTMEAPPPSSVQGPGESRDGPDFLSLQSQIEALQQQQQVLLQQQVIASLSPQPNLPAGRGGAHRRIQSMGMGGGAANFNFPMPGMSFSGPFGAIGMPDNSLGVPRGHGRRHSVNVVNKSPTSSSVLDQFGGADGYDDGFAPPAQLGGHSRQASRADSSWRINGGAGSVGAGNGLGDLAQAQAQLQSLQQFRAAAGGHHQKMASFSFPNMLPNIATANMMGLNSGGYNLLQQQHQQFQMQLQQQNQPQRKSLFAPYLPQASLPPLLAAGKLVVGTLRVNKRNRSDAYVSTDVLDADIYICGSKDRNRALEGDMVAVELLNVDEVWSTKKEKEEKKRKKEENSVYEARAQVGRKSDKKKDDVEVEGQGLMLFEDEEVTDEVKPQFAGHVVAVVERMPGQLFSGTLGLLRPSSAATKEKQEAERREREGITGEEIKRTQPSERPKIVWFKPTDKRVPLIAIPTEQAPPDFVQNAEAYADRLFVACIKRHPISSLHPFGTLVEDLGPIGDVEVETSALLKDCNFPTEEFAENVLKCLPPVPWTIPERELENRKDMRAERVFTIDPETAKDLDDALSIKHNEDGTYDIGVHIADVSHFVKPNTALDRDARKRATSVYLVQRAVPMLPPMLCDELCSLLPDKERLAFSVIFTMSDDGQVVRKWFGKTAIKSAAKLAYSDAQNVVDGKSLGSISVAAGHAASDIESDIKILHSLAKQLRTRRFENGCLSLDSTRLHFELDENGMPTDCSAYMQTDAHYLIQEFMILANTSVASQIALHLPEQALLRRHEDPIERRLVGFAERAARLGYAMDTSSSGALMKSFDAITDPAHRRIIEMLSFKATHRARYFCAGMLDIAKYHHFALNAPLYTHFTSPIRRYADVLVHRQLDSILAGTTAGSTDPKFSMDRDAVAKAAQQCNTKRDNAKLAQEQSAHLYLCSLIADLTQRYGPVVRQAKVVGVLDAAFDVFVPEFGIEKRVHVDQMPIDNHVYDEHSHVLQIYWSERDVITWLAETSDDEHLKKVKENAEQHTLRMEITSRSVHDEKALFDEDDDADEVVIGRPGKDEKPEKSKQRLLSMAKIKPEFQGLHRTAAGHRIQDIKELQNVPVIVTADLTKSPPVIKVYSVNPYAAK